VNRAGCSRPAGQRGPALDGVPLELLLTLASGGVARPMPHLSHGASSPASSSDDVVVSRPSNSGASDGGQIGCAFSRRLASDGGDADVVLAATDVESSWKNAGNANVELSSIDWRNDGNAFAGAGAVAAAVGAAANGSHGVAESDDDGDDDDEGVEDGCATSAVGGAALPNTDDGGSNATALAADGEMARTAMPLASGADDIGTVELGRSRAGTPAVR
jgi:hypothetical protein